METVAAPSLQREPEPPAQVDLYDALAGLCAAIEARDPYTCGHSERVAAYAAAVARALGWPAAAVEAARRAALLHDLGKLGVPDAVLQKPGRLTATDWVVMGAHPDLGAQVAARLLQHVRGAGAVVAGIRHHHERYDGAGYPAGLAAGAIPPLARVLAVADALDAITSARPYRAARPWPAALTELARVAGTQLDPSPVEAALAALPGPPVPDWRIDGGWEAGGTADGLKQVEAHHG